MLSMLPHASPTCAVRRIWHDTYFSWRFAPCCPISLCTLQGMAALLSMACAIWVGMTRIQDYWHHPDDVFAGWALGALCARIGYAAAAPQSTAAHDEPAAAGSDVQLLMSPMHKV
eukprot:TRINITY_DN7311_c0_g2_i1.p4 TRINITY_DN7311_c0_g2~~TRINITY_DN7311_c0_g2_i1.p4  ORF type:complete len:115 (-),score=18.36 TRINITY_DN7311_c0_g2_i1:156-500(-)